MDAKQLTLIDDAIERLLCAVEDGDSFDTLEELVATIRLLQETFNE